MVRFVVTLIRAAISIAIPYLHHKMSVQTHVFKEYNFQCKRSHSGV